MQTRLFASPVRFRNGFAVHCSTGLYEFERELVLTVWFAGTNYLEFSCKLYVGP